MKRPKKAGAPKSVSYVLIPPQSELGRPMYERLYLLVDAHHADLSRTDVRIALAWATSWTADVDGRLTLGKCKKATDLDRELAPYDFVILLNRDFWQNGRVTDAQRQALMDHELMHAACVYDAHGEIKVDERGRTCYRIRKHDLEEFADIVTRHGCYKRDIEDFAQALARAEHSVSTWVGYTSLHETLKALGVAIAPEVIATWSDFERREVATWAALRDGADVKTVNVATSSNVPPCLMAALATPGRLETVTP
jgi:hypothetical protein